MNPFTVAPPNGTPVHFYEHANDNNQPKPAVVLETSPRGVLRIGIMDKHGGTIESRPTVYHINDSCLRDSKGHPTPAATRNGGWDYHPWFLPPAGSFDMTDRDRKVSRVCELSKEFAFQDVCTKVRGLGLKKADVEEIYDRHHLSDPVAS